MSEAKFANLYIGCLNIDLVRKGSNIKWKYINIIKKNIEDFLGNVSSATAAFYYVGLRGYV